MSGTLFAQCGPELEDLAIRTERALTSLEKTSDPTFKSKLLKHERHDTVKDLTKLDKALGTALQLDRMMACMLGIEEREQRLVPSGIWATGAPTIWKQGITGRTCLVGIIDTGIYSKHPDLKGKVVIARDYVRDGLPMERWQPHGTHVAGTIAARGKIMGMAPNCKLADYRVLGENGGGSPLNVTRAIYQATLDGCKVINLSLGSKVDFRPMHAAIQNAVRNGVMVVVAVGNSGDGNPATEEISYPGYYHEVCGAGAVQFVTRADVAESIKDAYFSNTNKEVDVAAPGWQVMSTVPGGYAAMSGTSMAAPHVSGFAALLYDKAKIRTQRVLPPGMLFAAVKSTTVDIRDLGIDVTTGAGFITFYPAVPRKRQGKWVLEEMELGMPEIGATGNRPPAAALSKEVERMKRFGAIWRHEAAAGTSGVTS